MRTLFRRFVRWITQAQRFERLEFQVSILQQAILLPVFNEEPLEIESAFYDYGMLGDVYRITKNHELVTRRDF